jgi:hypothetical protein
MFTCEGGHAERDRAGVVLECCVDLGDLVLDAAVADLKSLDFPEPAFPFRLDDAGFQVIADLFESGALCRVRL